MPRAAEGELPLAAEGMAPGGSGTSLALAAAQGICAPTDANALAPERQEQNDGTPTTDEEENTLSQESAARQQFIDNWRSATEARNNSTAVADNPSRVRTRSFDNFDTDDDNSDEPSPSRYSNRNKQLRSVCCDCARGSSCGFNGDCSCRMAGVCCTDCDPEICGGNCTNRPGKFPARARHQSTALADRQRQNQLRAASTLLPPPPNNINNNTTVPNNPNNGLDGNPGSNGMVREGNNTTNNGASNTSTDGATAATTARDTADTGTTNNDSSGGTAAGADPPPFVFGSDNTEQQQQNEQQFRGFDASTVGAGNQQGEPDISNNNGAGNPGEGEEAANGDTEAAGDSNNEGNGDTENNSEDEDEPDDPTEDEWVWQDQVEPDPRMQPDSLANDVLHTVYGDKVHHNTGTHLHGDLDPVWDSFWRRNYRKIAGGTSNLINTLPSGKVVQRLILRATEEFKGCREGKWNSERVIVFFTVMLQKEPGKQSFAETRELITMRLNLWDQKKYNTLIQACLDRMRNRTVQHRERTSDQRARKFNAQVQAQKVRSAVRQATDRGEGGILDPFGYDPVSGKTVHEVLEDKHPKISVPDVASNDVHCFEDYDNLPGMLPLNVYDDILVKVARRMKGGAGPGGVESGHLKDMLLCFGRASVIFRAEMGKWIYMLSNTSPPIASYRAFMNNKLMAGRKNPGVRPINCGEIWRRYWAKCVIQITGFQATEECGSIQTCAGLPVGCEGAVHAMRRAVPTGGWDHTIPTQPEESADGNNANEALLTQPEAAGGGNSDESPAPLRGGNASYQPDINNDSEVEDGEGAGVSMEDILGVAADDDDNFEAPATGIGALLVDAENGFNNLKRYAMLWTVRHLWPRAARFVFNCYKFFAECFIMGGEGNRELVVIMEEGICQGCPLGIYCYGVGMVPLLKKVREATYLEEDTTMSGYADDIRATGTASQSATVLEHLVEWGPSFGYYPKPAKSFFVCDAKDEAAARDIFNARGLNIQYSRGERALGGFVGTTEALEAWLAPQIENWAHAVDVLADISRKFPQSAYYGLVASLQQEWQHVCRVVPEVGPYFGPVEDALKRFCCTLLDTTLDDQGDFRKLLSHKVKQAGLGIMDPTESAAHAFEVSERACTMLANAIRLGIDIDVVEFTKSVKGARYTGQMNREYREKAECARQTSNGDMREEYRIQRAKESGSWLTVQPSLRNGTILSREEFKDNIRYRCGLAPLDLPEYCDGCGAQFTTEHGLNCKKGGLVNERHDDAADMWAYLGSLAFHPSAVEHEPFVNDGNPTGAGNGGTAGAATPPALAPVFTRNNNTNNNNNANNNNNNNAGAAADLAVEPALQGDKGIRNFYTRGKGCIFDIRITNTECRTHRNKQPLKCLAGQEKAKKDKYEAACHEQRKDFSPLVYSIDGMAGPMTRAAEKRMASRLAWKWHRQYAEMCGYVRCRMSIAVVRSNTLMWRGSRTRRRAHYGFIDDGGAITI